MDQELREKFARLEAQVEALQGIPAKLDSMIQLQVTMASVQESTRGTTERLTNVMTDVSKQADRLDAVHEQISSLKNKIVGGTLVISILVIPTLAYFFKDAKDQMQKIDQQMQKIDQRVTGLEYQIQRARDVR